ncbi:MAG: hypothetical protein AUG07_05160 [Acidobacteria bacterium 13_1_20CM_2_60_10]|nr:MAG: hypothetical protein AUG07_05160 [Acidobacteria bacterium 13_1_20CM_2_60_10]
MPARASGLKPSLQSESPHRVLSRGHLILGGGAREHRGAPAKRVCKFCAPTLKDGRNQFFLIECSSQGGVNLAEGIRRARSALEL